MAGSVPWAASVIAAARYLGCTPWELLNQPDGWRVMASAMMAAEQEIQEEDSKKK